MLSKTEITTTKRYLKKTLRFFFSYLKVNLELTNHDTITPKKKEIPFAVKILRYLTKNI
jgi:uncharacterized protein YdaL